MVYIAKEGDELPPIDEPTTEMTGTGNVVVFKDIGFDIEPEQPYIWRVDCVSAADNKRRQSNTWGFTIKSKVAK